MTIVNMVGGGVGGDADVSGSITNLNLSGSITLPYIWGSRRDTVTFSRAITPSDKMANATPSKTTIQTTDSETTYWAPDYTSSTTYFNSVESDIDMSEKPFASITTYSMPTDLIVGDEGTAVFIWSGFFSNKLGGIAISGSTKLITLKFRVLENGIEFPDLYAMSYQDFTNDSGNLVVSRNDSSSGEVTIIPKLTMLKLTKKLNT